MCRAEARTQPEGDVVDRPKQFEKTPESEVRNAIDAFEQILQAMPEDRTALETLYEAYEHIGDRGRAVDYLVRLATQVMDEGDTSAIPWIHDALLRHTEDHADAKKLQVQIEAYLAGSGTSSPSAEKAPVREESGKGVDISGELALAWSLRQDDVLSQEEYSTIVQDVTENSTKHIDVPVTVLHAIDDRNFANLNQILAHISRDSVTPFISLSMFEFDFRKFSALPASFATQRGAMVYERMGQEVLVAVLNPYNKDLRNDVEKALGQTCHYYLVSPEDYNAFLERSVQSVPAAGTP